jgi:1-acyl-sn-glycerol-3-phosphate acyltransferase
MPACKFLNNLKEGYFRISMYVFFTFFLVIGYIITPVFPKRKRKYVWRKIARIGLKFVFWSCFIQIETYQRYNIPKGPCVIAMNHRSFIDTLTLLVHFKRYFFVITEPFDAMPHPLVQQWVFNLGYLPVIRDEKDKKLYRIGMSSKYVVRACVNRVRQGETLIIYPEGHHEKRRGLLKFKTGAVRIALETGVPLIAGVFTDSDKHITPEKNRIHPGKIHLRFGNCLNISKHYGKQDDRKLVRKLTGELKKEINDLIHHRK